VVRVDAEHAAAGALGRGEREHVSDEPPLTMSERVRLRETERELRELRQKVVFLEKVAAYFASEPR
jgi:transposase